MIMFFVVAAAAFTAMAMVPPAGAAFATLGTATQTVQTKAGAEEQQNVGLSDIDIACGGQAWGAQTR